MGTLTFSDGMKFETEGPFRAVRKEDGWYVVGHGSLIPVSDSEEAEELIRTMEEEQKAERRRS